MTFFDVLAAVCTLTGSAFCVVGAVGLLRFPEFYCRTHAAGITDTLGAGLVLVGLCFLAGPTLVTVKLITILCFLWLTSPAATHALAKAAYFRGVRVTGSDGDDRAG
jgi:multicomponent Na+:H+ antiporter subunit G